MRDLFKELEDIEWQIEEEQQTLGLLDSYFYELFVETYQTSVLSCHEEEIINQIGYVDFANTIAKDASQISMTILNDKYERMLSIEKLKNTREQILARILEVSRLSLRELVEMLSFWGLSVRELKLETEYVKFYTMDEKGNLVVNPIIREMVTPEIEEFGRYYINYKVAQESLNMEEVLLKFMDYGVVNKI